MKIAQPVLLGLALMAPFTGAGGGCIPDPTFNIVAVGDHYLVMDLCQIGGTCLHSIWIYEESNGIGDLQRHDEYRDDTCGGAIPADTVIVSAWQAS